MHAVKSSRMHHLGPGLGVAVPILYLHPFGTPPHGRQLCPCSCCGPGGVIIPLASCCTRTSV